jgi:hypothetical protein
MGSKGSDAGLGNKASRSYSNLFPSKKRSVEQTDFFEFLSQNLMHLNSFTQGARARDLYAQHLKLGLILNSAATPSIRLKDWKISAMFGSFSFFTKMAQTGAPSRM